MHVRPAAQAPMPRSQQLMLAAQRSGLATPTSPVPPIPRSLASNLASPTVTVGGYPTMAPKPRSAVVAAAASASTQPSPNLDLHKYKTKLCRNYQNGLACPFEDRCVFAHGEDQIMKAGTVPTPDSSFERAPRSTTSAYGPSYEFPYGPEPTLRRPRRQSFTNLSQTPTTASDEDMNLAGGPPTYEAFMGAHTGMPYDEPSSPMESSLPTRFRFDPYCFNGFVYVRA